MCEHLGVVCIRCVLTLTVSMSSSASSVYAANCSAPTTEPCGTPHVNSIVTDVSVCVLMTCVRSDAYMTYVHGWRNGRSS